MADHEPKGADDQMRVRREPVSRDWAWFDRVTGPVDVVAFEREDARAAGAVRAALAAAGAAIGPYDVLIAGQALARGATLVTHNVREFGRVAGLGVEDWE
jgi:predicted nucleic acid-binding protein